MTENELDTIDAEVLAVRESALPSPTSEAPRPWRQWLEVYFNAKANFSAHTRRAYKRHIEAALESIGREYLHELSGAALAAYGRQLADDSSKGPATRAQALAALRSFLKWARPMGGHSMPADILGAVLEMPTAKVRRPYQVLTDNEVDALLKAAETPRNRALLAVGIGAGLRAAEIVGLDISDAREDEDGESFLWVRQGKGGKDRKVPIQQDTAGMVRDYLEATGRTLADKGALFRAHDRGVTKRERKRLTTRAVGAVMAKAVSRAEIKGKALSPHSLRHTFAIRYLRDGGGIDELSKLLGHSSVAITQRYADHRSMAEMRAHIPPLFKAA